MLAPLRYDGLTVGAIAVHDRLGEVRGFSASDVQLLQTIANHASVALHNEMLIGRLRHDALHDTLTGLPNRAQLTTHANVALADARTGGGEVALMIIDLNGFKVVNDTLGHHVGDDLLGQVAQRFADAAPWGVTVARLGGDEFAVLVPPAVPVQADKVAHLLLETLNETFTVGEERLHLSGSAGIALAPAHGRNVSDLLKRADIAMYAAKNGPDACVLYRADIDVNDPSLLSLMGELREAIAAGEVDIEVEPVMDLQDGRVVSTEALVRWHHPVRGTLRPGLFLPLAERNGLIVPLTTLVLDRAVAACASWREAGLDIGISVNLSARSLLDTLLPNTVAEALERWGLPSNRLTLEITETIVLSDADRALEMLADLRRLGVRLSLDDFGTGYSSLTHLSELPIQQLKIDRSFVSQVHDSPARPGHRRRRRRPGRPPRPRGRRRGHREARDGRPARRAGLRARPGPLLRAVHVARAAPAVDGHPPAVPVHRRHPARPAAPHRPLTRPRPHPARRAAVPPNLPKLITCASSTGAVGSRQVRVRWKFWNDREGVGPRWPW